ncbi:DUF6483 family protein [Clostridium swellfunianum]|uniref:DUF6483 family protein n=1 Tax=Clostridium swellfunianum TaxID=1367462 RepID=UPI00202EA5DD|nr:DUF6483 family protein [Clostridium swellfunianum]MCM0650298.1 DUF6483 family protein [Clostridium swellfunianum]
MNIEKLINELAKNVSKAILNKEDESSETINLNDIGSEDILKIILKRLVYAGEFNNAEDILFEEISKNNSQEIYEIALDFYNLLLEKSDKELEEGNFTRSEIYQGLEDIKKTYWSG